MRKRAIVVGEKRVKALLDLKHYIDTNRHIENNAFCAEREIDRGFIYMLENQGIISKITRGKYKWLIEGEMNYNDAEALLQIVLEKYNKVATERMNQKNKEKREAARQAPVPPSEVPAPYRLNGTVSPASVLSPYKIVHYEEVGELDGYVVLRVLAYRRPPIAPQEATSEPQGRAF